MAVRKVASVDTWSKYKRADVSRKCRTIGMSSGEVGSGKTHLWLTAPGKMLVQSLDKGMEGVVEKLLAEEPDKEIYVKEYDWNPAGDFDQDYAVALRDEILEDFTFGLENGRTVLWDKETDIREVFQYAEFGDPTSGNVKDYGKFNQRYFHLINKAKSIAGVNVGFIQSMKDEWAVVPIIKNGEKKTQFTKTGKRIRAGFERLDELVMTELYHERANGEFCITIGKCRQNDQLQDTVNPGAFTFPQFGTLLMPDTEESDWI